jgi:peptide/nickel transport system ATP-binding protein
MYGGKVVEEGDVRTIFKNPQHPYTVGLIKSVPDLRETKSRLYSIPGNVPKPGSVKTGCYFAERCDRAMAKCHTETPELISTLDNHQVRCWLYEEGKGEAE